MAEFDKIILNGTTYTIPEGGGGGNYDYETEGLTIASALVELHNDKADKNQLNNYQLKGNYVEQSAVDASIASAVANCRTEAEALNVENVDAAALNDLNKRVSTIEQGGGGGGATYTAGDGIEIDENNVITNTREQRVLIDEDDDTGLHSGFIVKSPHWNNINKDVVIHLHTWYPEFENNIPVENADPYTQTGFLVSNRMKFTIGELHGLDDPETALQNGVADNGDGTYTISLYMLASAYLEVNGTVVSTGNNGTVDVTITNGDVLIYNNGCQIMQYFAYFDDESTGYCDDWRWMTTNTAYVVHNGQESQLADSSSVETLVRNSVGYALVSPGSTTAGTDLGKYTDNQLYIYPDADITYPSSSTIYGKTTRKAKISNKLTNTEKNLTVGFDQTYQEQQEVTYYAYNDQIDPYYFFGDGVYGGNWYGQANTFVEKLNDEYYINIPLDNLATNLAYPLNIMVYADDMNTGSQKELYVTINNNKLIASTVNGYEVMTDFGNYNINELVAFVVNGVKKTVNSSGQTVLIDNVSNLTSFGIMPTETGNYQFQQGSYPYIQFSSQPSSFEYRTNTLWPYTSTGTVTVQYQNHPEKLNHYIRYAGETGTAVGNRKAYILTDKNIGQVSTISSLGDRVTNLEGKEVYTDDTYGVSLGQALTNNQNSVVVGKNVTRSTTNLTNTIGIGNYLYIKNTKEIAIGLYNNSVSTGTNSDKTHFSVASSTSTSSNRRNCLQISNDDKVYFWNNANTDMISIQSLEARIAALETALGGMTLVSLTQAQYEALTVKDNNTLYIITPQ